MPSLQRPFQLSEFVSGLPQFLQERVSLSKDAAVRYDGEYVLYWMHNAMRGHENPALDAAINLSNELGKPVVVFQELLQHDPYASDRHHAFVLQGACDVQHELLDRGINYVFHLERSPEIGSQLVAMAKNACAVITEDMPVEPYLSKCEKLKAESEVALACVDTACVVPMKVVSRAYERAFEYRQKTEKAYQARLTLPWGEASVKVRENSSIAWPFQPLDFSVGDIPQWLAECDIDHSISPVAETTGGTVAGYQRWNDFKSHRLAAYDKTRNNAVAATTSCLSPYFHHGMISPLRVAREAALLRNSGAEKYLDELLIWRELAYCFCRFRPDHATWQALPKWAQETLQSAAKDSREEHYTWEQLAFSKTSDSLWNAAQRSLLLHGELHNNLRMTWGKMLLNWIPDPQVALKWAIDLNHRYALDGRDPASYGGILWCFGQFDRPFPPTRPIFGTVRDRSTEEHARRLEPIKYANHVESRLSQKKYNVAIIGAGISGLNCARLLTEHGHQVTVFEKSRGVGGRMATKRGSEGPKFDHGAQYFTARDERFRRMVDAWVEGGIVSRWQGKIATIANGEITYRQDQPERFVGVPGMTQICKHLAASCNVLFEKEVAPLQEYGGGWHLISKTGESFGNFDWVVSTAPAAQTANLVKLVSPDMASIAGNVEMKPCMAILVEFDTRLEVDFVGAFVDDSVLSWISRDSSKPQRTCNGDLYDRWVLHATAEASQSLIEDAADAAINPIMEAFWRATGLQKREPVTVQGHKWRYAIPANPLAQRFISDRELPLVAGGDWAGGPRVEGAFLSGMAMAGYLLSRWNLSPDAKVSMKPKGRATAQPTLFS